MIDIIKFYEEHNIPFVTHGHKHARKGWVGTPCPFCSGNPGFHLGYCIDPESKYAGIFTCHRCGGKNTIKVISRMTSLSQAEARKIIGKYSQGAESRLRTILDKRKGPQKAGRCRLPVGTEEMAERHRNYLIKRNFDPDKLERVWGLKGTGPTGPYKHRIIIPIYYQGRLVSYQGRDITGKSDLKYKACREEDEARDHKSFLYGLDKVPGDSIVVDEGVTDTWRLGPGSVAQFGVKFTAAQIRLLLPFKRIFILFDSKEDDPQAGEQAEMMAFQLYGGGREIELIDLLNGDPGDMTQGDADNLMKELLNITI